MEENQGYLIRYNFTYSQGNDSNTTIVPLYIDTDIKNIHLIT